MLIYFNKIKKNDYHKKILKTLKTFKNVSLT